MAELSTVEECREAFLRLLGTVADDPALTENDEAEGEVVDSFLTSGVRAAQRWMIDMGYDGWIARSAALSWSGADDTDGGRYASLPSDFLRAYGNDRVSALGEANGIRWGQEIDPEQRYTLQGDYYYVAGTRLWITKGASPPSTLYLDFHQLHEAIADGVTLDFPLEAIGLIPAEAACEAKEENWVPGGEEMYRKLERNRSRWQDKARKVARQTKKPRTFRKPPRMSNRY